MTENIRTIKEQIEKIKEYLDFGLLYSEYLDFANAVEGVEKALEQKDKEIAELKAKYDKDTHTLQNQLDVANADRVEKDKIIDVIVQEYEYKAGIDVKNFCEVEMKKDKCIQDCRCCIKHFFEKKVSEENEC